MGKLKMTKEIFKDIINFSPSVIFVKDLDGRFLFINHEDEKIFNIQCEELIGQKHNELWPERIAKKFEAQDKEVIKTGVNQVWEDSVTVKGENRTYITNKFLLFDSDRKPYALGGIATDITERKQTEKRLRKAQVELEKLVEKRMTELIKVNKKLKKEVKERIHIEKELIDYQKKLHSLSSEMLLTEERERRRIAGELHDRIGHALAISKIKLEKIQSTISESNFASALEELHDLIEQTINDTRSLIFDLSPPILYELGLVAAVEWLIEKFQEDHGIRIEFDSKEQSDPIDKSLRFLLFRAIHELLLNSVRHGNAKNVRVSIKINTDQVSVDVADNGIGFNKSELNLRTKKNIGFGLFSISERLKEYGGKIVIDSQPGNGTRVHLDSMLRKEWDAI